MQAHPTLDSGAIAASQPAEKIGLVATVNPQGLPHISLITSLRALSATRLTLGEFCKGWSKAHLQENPKTGFLIMTRDRRLWRGTARWTHLRQEGPEYEQYNDLPMFRYNAYFGIHTVHYLDLVSAMAPQTLPLGPILGNALLTRLVKSSAKSASCEAALKPFAERLFNNLSALKFLAYIQESGYPVIIPILQCQAADRRRLVFAAHPYGDELDKIAGNRPVAIFGLTMAMENVLIRGSFRGFARHRLTRLGIVDIDWVYNSMPPCHGQIYPPVELTPIVDF